MCSHMLLQSHDLKHHLVADDSPNRAAPVTDYNTAYNKGRFAFMSYAPGTFGPPI